MIDQTAIKFNQAAIVALLSAAWLLESVALVAFVAAVLLVGTVWPAAALFQQIYRALIKPMGLLKPRPKEDRQSPHRFAQGFGAVVVSTEAVLIYFGVATIGWALALLVVGLALINLLVDFCAGCMVFYQLERLGIIRVKSGDSTSEEKD